MIGTLATDLLTKLKTITEFGTTTPRVGLTIGGKTLDPIMENITKPACWVVFTGDANTNQDRLPNACNKTLSYSFVVKIVIDYKTDNDMINVQFPVLEDVVSTIHGTKVSGRSDMWRYIGQALEEITDKRVVFNQTYTIAVNS